MTPLPNARGSNHAKNNVVGSSTATSLPRNCHEFRPKTALLPRHCQSSPYDCQSVWLYRVGSNASKPRRNAEFPRRAHVHLTIETRQIGGRYEALGHFHRDVAVLAADVLEPSAGADGLRGYSR
jgi:hypothetical protein